MVLRVLAPAAGLLLAWVGAAQATTYSFTSIDVGSGGRSYADGINNLGQIVGFYAVASSPQYLGFLYSGGVFTTILVPGSSNTVAEGINNEGQIVGNYSDASGTHGFVDTGGVFTTINGPAGSDAAVTGINDVGQITGYYNNPNQTTSFLGTAGNLVTFGTGRTGASGINNAGQVVGSEGFKRLHLQQRRALHDHCPGPTRECRYGIIRRDQQYWADRWLRHCEQPSGL